MKLASNCPLYVEPHGEGPMLLLGHGFGGSGRNFRPQVRVLRKRARVVLFDARGHARSATPPEPEAYAPEHFVEDMGGILDALGAARAVVGGLSMGAGIALRFALAHPERVRGLVLAAFPPGGSEGVQRWAHEFAECLEHEGLDGAGVRYVWGPDSGLETAAARWVRQGFLEHAPHALAHILRQVIARQPSPDALAPELGQLETPTLVVVGSADTISRRACQRLAELLPRARLVEIESAGHVVNLEKPEAFNHALEEFLDELDAG